MSMFAAPLTHPNDGTRDKLLPAEEKKSFFNFFIWGTQIPEGVLWVSQEQERNRNQRLLWDHVKSRYAVKGPGMLET